jgi:hypothetical protein
VTAQTMATEQDVRRLLGIANDDRSDLPAQGLPRSLLADLAELVRCDAVSFLTLDSRAQTAGVDQSFPAEGEGDEDPSFWLHYWDSRPCSYPDQSGDLRSVTTVSDFYSVRQWHSTGMYADYFGPTGVEHELMMCLPPGPGSSAGPGHTTRLIFCAGPDPTSPNVTAGCSCCCARTCIRPTGSPNSAGAAPLS